MGKEYKRCEQAREERLHRKGAKSAKERRELLKYVGAVL
jgi:hypothetical protein